MAINIDIYTQLYISQCIYLRANRHRLTVDAGEKEQERTDSRYGESTQAETY